MMSHLSRRDIRKIARQIGRDRKSNPAPVQFEVVKRGNHRTARPMMTGPVLDIVKAHARKSTVNEILSPCRMKHVVSDRYAAIRAVHAAYPQFTLPDLGRIFGRDHTTIIHALRQAA